MTGHLSCGCWPAVHGCRHRCAGLNQLVNLKNAMAKAAAEEPDPTRRERLWQAHHRYLREIAAHLSGEAVAR